MTTETDKILVPEEQSGAPESTADTQETTPVAAPYNRENAAPLDIIVPKNFREPGRMPGRPVQHDQDSQTRPPRGIVLALAIHQ